MTSSSAPGKFILFGEHAVVFGKPALAIAVNLRISCTVSLSTEFTVNGHPMRKSHHAYISASLDEAWGGPPMNINTSSDIPSGSGLGSSAAVTVASIGAMLAHKGKFDPETIAKKAFEVESRVQGRASPTDTSTSSHGRGVLIAPERLDGFLWRVEKGDRSWNVHHCDVPQASFVVGYTGIHAATGPLVAKVRKVVEASTEGRQSIDRIGEIVMAGAEALKAADKRRIGSLMSENHELLKGLGVGHPFLDRLVRACDGISYGAKLTGAGGGGSMIALTDDAPAVAKAIRDAGGNPIITKVGCEGVRIEKALEGGRKR